MERKIKETVERPICISVLLQDHDYTQLRLERFRRRISTSECLSQALNAMLADQNLFSEVIRTSRLKCKLTSPKGKIKSVRIYLPLDLLIKLNEIYQTEFLARDLIIGEAFCLYAQRRKEREGDDG